jgi:hypothetical protein
LAAVAVAVLPAMFLYMLEVVEQVVLVEVVEAAAQLAGRRLKTGQLTLAVVAAVGRTITKHFKLETAVAV